MNVTYDVIIWPSLILTMLFRFFGFIAPKNIKLVGFPVFRFWAHYIIYQRFYLIIYFFFILGRQ
jgi:hypothetical protein